MNTVVTFGTGHAEAEIVIVAALLLLVCNDRNGANSPRKRYNPMNTVVTFGTGQLLMLRLRDESLKKLAIV
jgi:hypothetical protein